MPVDVDAVLRPHFEALMDAAGRPLLFDAHTHIGANDPDGLRQRPDELVEHLDHAGGARAVVFPMHEPDGYAAANDAALEAVARWPDRLVAFCRVDPNRGAEAVREARRCLDAGARGIKLHPRAEGFTLAAPAVRELVALLDDRGLAMLIHAGRGIPALGRDTVRLSGEFRDARLILAHCAISDLAWLWRELPDHPNVLIDTSWWQPSDLIALFALVSPGQIVWASDSPYGQPLPSLLFAARCALQCGLDTDRLRFVLGGQIERAVSGEPLADLGPPAGPGPAIDPLLERVAVHLTATLSRAFARVQVAESLGLARLAAAVGEGGPHAALFSAIFELLDLYERHAADPQPPLGQPLDPSVRLLLAALWLARTPDVPLPELPDAPAPTREEAE